MANISEAAEVTSLAARQRVEGVRRDATLSSRAHLVVMAFVVGREVDLRSPLAAGTLTRMLLVDLAGSERSSTLFPTTPTSPRAAEERLQESKAINASLSALGKVIIALSAGKPHVPYRDSTLTRVLQDGLGRSSSICLLACVHAGPQFVQETVATLQFASRCRKIEPVCTRLTRGLPWRHLGRLSGAARLSAALHRFAEDCCGVPEPDAALQQLSEAVDAATEQLRAGEDACIGQVAAVRPRRTSRLDRARSPCADEESVTVSTAPSWNSSRGARTPRGSLTSDRARSADGRRRQWTHRLVHDVVGSGVRVTSPLGLTPSQPSVGLRIPSPESASLSRHSWPRARAQ